MIAVLPFLLSMVPGSLLLGYSNVAGKQLLDRGVPEFFLIASSRLFMSAIAGVLLFFTGMPAIGDHFFRALSVTVVLNLFGQWAWYRAYKLEEASVIGPMRLLIPIFTLGTGFVFLGEAPTLWGALGVLLSICGLWLLLSQSGAGKRRTLREAVRTPAFLYAIAGAVVFATSFVFDKQVVLASSALVFSFATTGLQGLLTLLASLALERGRLPAKEVVLSPLFFAHAASLSFANILTAHALNFAPAAYASSVKRLESLWTVLFAGALLREGGVMRKAVACSIMLFGVALTVLVG